MQNIIDYCLCCQEDRKKSDTEPLANFRRVILLVAMVPVASRSGVRSSRTKTSSCAILALVSFPWLTLAKTPTVLRYAWLLFHPAVNALHYP